jgi:hypothetical protein
VFPPFEVFITLVFRTVGSQRNITWGFSIDGSLKLKVLSTTYFSCYIEVSLQTVDAVAVTVFIHSIVSFEDVFHYT